MEGLVDLRTKKFGGGLGAKDRSNRYYFNFIPDEILLKILRHLGTRDLYNLSLICKRLNDITLEASLKTTVFHKEDLELPTVALLRHWDNTSGYEASK